MISNIKNYNIENYKSEVFPIWKDYTTTISDPIYAISLEMACFLRFIVEEFPITSALDFGSGLSSYIIRKYGHCSNISVDDDNSWLDKTKTFLNKYNTYSDQVISLDKFKEDHNEDTFDLIFHDIGMDNRPKLLEYSFNHTKYLILDDMHFSQKLGTGHWEYYPKLVKSMINDKHLQYYDLKPYTLDKYGRFAYLCICK